MVMKIFTNAFHGLRDWVVQRSTAAIMAIYSVTLLVLCLVYQPTSYAVWKTLMGNAGLRLMTLLFLLSLFAHAWIGVKDVLVDYIKPLRLRQFLHYATAISLFAYAAWSAHILWNA